MSFKAIIDKVTGQPESHNKRSKYHFGKVLGAGTFGVVKLATVKATREEVAVKIILKKTLKGKDEMVMEELAMLQQLHHPHIVEFKDWFESKDKYYIVTQLAIGGELFDRIVNQGRFTEADAANRIRDVIDAIAYLHDKNIVHRDIKPENLLFVTEDPDSSLVLADFGIAKSLSSKSDMITSAAGSLGYAAPEVLSGQGHGMPCDIWSFGVVAYTVLSGYSPFRAETANDFLLEVSDGYEVVFHTRYWKNVSALAKDFIRCAIKVKPSDRWTAKDLQNHPWLAGTPNDITDLLPDIKEGFSARKKFKFAYEAIRLSNRLKRLAAFENDSSDSDEDKSPTNPASSPRTKASATQKFQEVVLAAARTKDLNLGN